jgi:hypothetical protein
MNEYACVPAHRLSGSGLARTPSRSVVPVRKGDAVVWSVWAPHLRRPGNLPVPMSSLDRVWTRPSSSRLPQPACTADHNVLNQTEPRPSAKCAIHLIRTAFQMKVVCDKLRSSDIDLGNQRDSSPKSLLKRLDPWQKPTWPPKVGLPFESDHAWTGNAPSRQSGLPVVGGRSPGALG